MLCSDKLDLVSEATIIGIISEQGEVNISSIVSFRYRLDERRSTRGHWNGVP